MSHIMRNITFFMIVAFTTTIDPSTAFTSISSAGQVQHREGKSILMASINKIPPEKAYGETSRQFRRTFFTHKDWMKHRSENRFFKNVMTTVKSGVVRQLAGQVGFVILTSSFVVAWNSLLVEGYVDFSAVHHDALIQSGLPLMKLPIEPFTLSSPALGLLLGECILLYCNYC